MEKAINQANRSASINAALGFIRILDLCNVCRSQVVRSFRSNRNGTLLVRSSYRFDSIGFIDKTTKNQSLILFYL